jgi:hypothetical protein
MDRKMTPREQAIREQELIEGQIQEERTDRLERMNRLGVMRGINPIEESEDISSSSRDVSSAVEAVRGRGRPPNQDIILIQQTLGLERTRGTDKPNEVKFSSFKNNSERLPSDLREQILQIVAQDKERAQRTNRSKISPAVAKEIADILRRN